MPYSVSKYGLAAAAGMLFLPIGAFAQESVILNLWMHEYPARESFDAKMIQGFEEANPGVKIEFSRFPDAQFDQRLQIGFAGGEGPDIFNNGSFNLGQYLASNILAPIDLAAIGADTNADLQARFGVGVTGAIVNDVAYGLPTEVSNYACVANNELWSAAGLDPATDAPKTWEEMVVVAEKLTQRDSAGAPVKRGFDFNWSAPIFMWLTFNAMVEQAGGQTVDEITRTAQFNSDPVKKTMQFWADWANEWKLGGPQYPASRDAFNAGDLATECTFGAWGQAGFASAGIDYTFFPVPRWEDAELDTGFNAYAYFLMVNENSSDEKKKLAWKFADYYTSHATELYQEAGLFTTAPAVVELEDFTSNPTNLVFQQELQSAVFSPRIPGFNEVGDALIRARDRVVTGGEEMDTVLSDLQYEVTEILSRY